MDGAETIEELRNQVSLVLKNLTGYMRGNVPPVIQELTLAQRHLEDARMRLGVAMTYRDGKNPWADNKKEAKS